MTQLMHPVSQPRAARPSRAAAPSPTAPAAALPAALADRAIERARTELPWLATMPERRIEVLRRLTVAGVNAFERALADPVSAAPSEMFAAAPRELVRSISLQQTLQLMRITSEVVEQTLSDRGQRETSIIYSRELAFAAAALYAAAGDGNGLWEHRLEQYVVDAARRGPLSEALQARIAAVGWRGRGAAVAAWGRSGDDTDIDRMRRLAWGAGADILIGEHDGGVAVIAQLVECRDSDELPAVIAAVADAYGPTTVAVGPVVAGIGDAHASLLPAVSAAAVVTSAGLAGAGHVVTADDVLPERALAGDLLARRALIERAYVPLARIRQPLLATARNYLDSGGSVEATSRLLGVHPNTVRYRLKRVADATGFDPTAARDAFVLQCALRLGVIDAAARAA